MPVAILAYGGPVDRVGVEWLGNRPQQLMALSPGTTIGHYDVTALIGEGGLGWFEELKRLVPVSP